MKLSKHFSIFIFIAIALNLFAAISVNAVVDNLKKLPNEKPDYINPAGTAPIGEVSDAVILIINIVKYAYIIFFIISIFMILMAAYTYLTAQAEPEKIKNATNQIIWASVAIVVALLAVSVNVIIKNFIDEKGSGNNTSGAVSPTYD